MSSGEENSSESPTMEFIEEQKPNIQHPLPTPLPSTIPSNPPASPPHTLFTSNSPPPQPQPPAPQPPSAITSPPLPPSTFSTSAPPPRFFTNSPPPQLPPAPHPPSAITSPSLPPSTFTSPPPPRPPRFSDKLDDDQYFDSFPPGYRFCPHDHELVMHYLTKKVKGLPLPRNRIVDVTLYQHDPEFLADKYKHYGEKEWYFFTPRERKYRNGTRPNRAAGDGYWKATGADKQVTYDKAVVGGDRRVTVEKVLVGYRKALVYYHGKAPKGDKTNWIMHEYRVKGKPQVRNHNDDMRLDDWVLCRIYKKHEKRNNVNTNVRNRQRNEENCSASVDDIDDQNYVTYHDRDSNDLADYGEDIGSLENAFPTLDESSHQHTGMSGYFSDCINSYPSSRLFDQDTQVPNLDDIYVGPAPTLSTNPYINWISSQRGCQDEFLNPTSYMPQYCNNSNADPYSAKPINLPRNPSPVVNFRPTNTTAPPAHGLSYMNTAPPAHGLSYMNTAPPAHGLPYMNTAPPAHGLPYMNTAPPTGTLPPTNTASLTCSLPPMNSTGCLPHTNPNRALVTSRLAPTNPATSQPMSAMNAGAKLPRQPPRAQQQ